jgi:pyruvate-formate lyase-activating enzyme
MLLHALIPASRANGPGLRAVVFFQGCSTPGVNRYEEETAAAGRRVIRDLGGPLTVMPPSKSEA